MGQYEDDPYLNGTEEKNHLVYKAQAKCVASLQDIVEAIEEEGPDRFMHQQQCIDRARSALAEVKALEE